VPIPVRHRLADFANLADPLPGGGPSELAADATMSVRPWVDEVIDTLGFDPRSAYVETFWLSILGPSTTWLLRRVAAAFDRSPEGFVLPLADTARELGLGDKGGRHSPFMRALVRCCQFSLARVADGGELEVRRRLPPLNRRQVQHLPEPLHAAHETWQSSRIGAVATEEGRRRARALALALIELDPEATIVEQRLVGLGVHPATARDASTWAWDRHLSAARAIGAVRAVSGGGGSTIDGVGSTPGGVGSQAFGA